MTTQRARQKQAIKQQRVPVGGARTNLQLSTADLEEFKRRRMHPRWVNDANGGVEQRLAGGYTFVDPKHAFSLGGQIAVEGDNTDIESKVSKVVSRSGPPIIAFLMEISYKFLAEDNRLRHEQTMPVDRALQAVQDGGQTIESGYTPD